MGQERVGESGRGVVANIITYQYNFWKTNIIRGNFKAITFSVFPSPTNNIIHKIQYMYTYIQIYYTYAVRG